MQVGDIVFIKGARKKSVQIIWGQFFYNILFKLGNICNDRTLLHGDFSHIAMYIGYGTFIEAYPNKKNGVRLSKYTDILNPNRTRENWKIYRNKNFYNQHSNILKNIEPFLEKKFEMKYKNETKDTYFCSKLIYSILDNIRYFDMPYAPNSHKIYPDHFYTMITENKNDFWKEVTIEYKLNKVEQNFMATIAKEYMRNTYSPLLNQIYKTNLTYAEKRFYELTDNRISNYLDLNEKILNGTASEEEIYEFNMIKDEDIPYSCLTISSNLLACFWSSYEA